MHWIFKLLLGFVLISVVLCITDTYPEGYCVDGECDDQRRNWYWYMYNWAPHRLFYNLTARPYYVPTYRRPIHYGRRRYHGWPRRWWYNFT